MIRILHRRETAAKPGWGIVFYRGCGALSVFAPCHGLLGFNSMRSCRCSWRYRKPAANHAKYAREENRLPGLPDDAITAQFLAVAEWPRLDALLYDLAAERKEAGYSYGWYVTVALQRIHGLSPARVREMRARLKAPTKARTNVATAPRPTPFRATDAFCRKPSGREQSTGSEQRADTEQLKQQIRVLAAARSMR